ncbi:MAG: hypothetical protein ACJ75H_24440 [Thermoanaerobaculia bacterium]
MQHIHLWQVVGLAILIAAMVYFKRQQNAQKGPPAKGGKAGEAGPKRAAKMALATNKDPETEYMDLRRQAIETTAENLGVADPKGNQVFGTVMEMGIPNSVVTLACFADGDASLYYKTGGGMIGGIGHENVRKAAAEFTTLARKAVARMTRTTEYPLPEPDRVRFYVLTARGVFTTETDRETLADPGSDLGALFYSGQEVVSQMREVQEQKARPASRAPAPDEAEP